MLTEPEPQPPHLAHRAPRGFGDRLAQRVEQDAGEHLRHALRQRRRFPRREHRQRPGAQLLRDLVDAIQPHPFE